MGGPWEFGVYKGIGCQWDGRQGRHDPVDGEQGRRKQNVTLELGLNKLT